MLSLLRLFGFGLLLAYISALLFALPLPNNDTLPAPNLSASAAAQQAIDPEVDQILQPLDDFSDISRGSLAFSPVQDDGSGVHYLLSPLLSTDVDIQVTGLVVRTRVTQAFINSSEQWMHATYLFPLPAEAAVDHLDMRIGERVIEGQIHPRQRARKIFEQAKKAGKQASLLVQQRPNLFTNRIANIAPGEKIEITIEYQHSLNLDNGQFSLRFPMTLTPRYKPGDSLPDSFSSQGWGFPAQQDAEADEVETSAAADSRELATTGRVRIKVLINMGMQMEQINSEFHPVTQSQPQAQQYQVSLVSPATANKDFVLNWRAQAKRVPQTALFRESFAGEEYGLAMIMPPSVDHSQMPVIAKDVTFILDTSGSMAGDSIQQAKLALRLAISELRPQDSFNVIEFNSHARAMWSYAHQANQGNKSQAIQFITGLEANGGTEILEALQLALPQAASSEDGRVRQVIFITDGSVGNESQLMQFIEQHIGSQRLFTVGIGSAPNSYFMQEAALAGKGTFTYIGSLSQVQDKMLGLLRKLQYPALTNLTLDLGPDVEVYPTAIPDLYFGEPLLVSFKGDVSNRQLSLGADQLQTNIRIKVPEKSDTTHTGLHAIWARNKIDSLSRQRRHQPDPQPLNQQIEQIALMHHLVSEFTSLVAVDVTPVRPTASKVKDTQIANRMPAGSQMAGSLPQTATPAQQHLLFGMLLMGLGLCVRYFRR